MEIIEFIINLWLLIYLMLVVASPIFYFWIFVNLLSVFIEDFKDFVEATIVEKIIIIALMLFFLGSAIYLAIFVVIYLL